MEDLTLTSADQAALLGVGKGFKEKYDKAFEEVKSSIGDLSIETGDALGKLTMTVAEMREKYDKQIGEMRSSSGGGFYGGSTGKLTQELCTAVPAMPEIIASQGKNACLRVKVNGKTFYAIKAGEISGVSRQVGVLLPGLAALPQFMLRVRYLLTNRTITGGGGAVEMLQQDARTLTATPTAELTKKPQSTAQYSVAMKSFETIPTWFKVSKQTLSDLPAIGAQIESDGVYACELELEKQILKGSGVSPELGPGLYNSAPAAAALPPVTDPTPANTIVDGFLAAMGELLALGYKPNGIVMAAADAAVLAMLKDTNGNYLNVPSILPPVVYSPHLASGEWLTGEFSRAVLAIREDVSIEFGYENDDFTRNIATVLFETRAAMGNAHPEAFRKNAPPTP